MLVWIPSSQFSPLRFTIPCLATSSCTKTGTSKTVACTSFHVWAVTGACSIICNLASVQVAETLHESWQGAFRVLVSRKSVRLIDRRRRTRFGRADALGRTEKVGSNVGCTIFHKRLHSPGVFGTLQGFVRHCCRKMKVASPTCHAGLPSRSRIVPRAGWNLVNVAASF